MNNTVQLHNRWLIFRSTRVANPRCCPIIAGAPSIVTENIFFASIPLYSKFLVKVLSMSFSLVVPYIGFKQQSFSCTLPLLQYLATIAKRGLSFISMLSSRATLKTFSHFNATVCCLVTSVAMSVIRLSIVRENYAY